MAGLKYILSALLLIFVLFVSVKLYKSKFNEGFASAAPSTAAKIVSDSCPSLSPAAAAAAAAADASAAAAKVKAAEIAKVTSKMVSDNIVDSSDPSGLNISCPSGEKPIVSLTRNTKHVMPLSNQVKAADPQANSAARTCGTPAACGAPAACATPGTGGGYNFDPSKEYQAA